MMTGYVRSFETDRNVKRTARSKENTHRIAGELLLELGVAPHLCGFDPLCNAIRFTAERERSRPAPSLTGMQQAFGALCRERNPEHAVRDAIGAGFLGTDEIHTKLFPFSDRPSSAEFVCTLAELVRDRILPG